MKTIHEIGTRRKKSIGLLLFLFVLCLNANAQFDPLFTQYMNNEMFVNPAYTGTRKVLATTLLYRNQWVGIKGAPITQTFSIHSPIGDHNGIGLSMMNESIGITHQFRVNGCYAYRIRTGDYSLLSFGLSGSLVNLRENYQDLELYSQNDHVFNISKPSIIAPNAGYGMFFYTNKMYVGLSIPRMIKNSIAETGKSSVKNSANPKDWHYFLTSAYIFTPSRDVMIKPSIMIREVYGAPLQAELAFHTLFNKVWWIGASYRTGDAITAITGFQIKPEFRFFYSYDYSLTKIQAYSSGSHEITISYDFAFKRKRIASPRLF